jgi:hypothetical protein
LGRQRQRGDREDRTGIANKSQDWVHHSSPVGAADANIL